jgi:hypothetical protein
MIERESREGAWGREGLVPERMRVRFSVIDTLPFLLGRNMYRGFYDPLHRTFFYC